MSLNLEVQILGEFKSLSKATQGAEKSLKGLQSSAQKVSRSINAALGAIGLGLSLRALAQDIKAVTKAASSDRLAQAKLAAQLRNTTNATDAQIASVEDQITAWSNATGILDDELRPAMSTLIANTGDITTANELMALAMDISVATGKDLTTVALTLARAQSGNFTSLKKLLPAIKENENWMQQLQDTYGGTAEEVANQDPYNKLRVVFENLKEVIGTAFLPLLDEFATWMQDNYTRIENLATLIGTKLKDAFDNTSNSVGTISKNLSDFMTILEAFVTGDTSKAPKWVADISAAFSDFKYIVNNMITFLQGIAEIVDGVIYGLFGWIEIFGFKANDLSSFLKTISDGLAWVGRLFRDTTIFGYNLGNVVGFILSLFVPLTATVKVFKWVFEGLFKLIGKAIPFFGKFADAMKTAVNLGDEVAAMATKMEKAAREGFVEWIDDAQRGMDGLIDKAFKLEPVQKLFFAFEKPLRKARDIIKSVTDWFGKLATKVRMAGTTITIFGKDVRIGLDPFLGWVRSTLGPTADWVREKWDSAWAAVFNDGYKPQYDAPIGPEMYIPKPGEAGFIGPVALSDAELKAIRDADAAREAAAANAEQARAKFKERVKKFIDDFRNAAENVRKAALAMKNSMLEMANNFRDTIGAAFGTIERGATFAFRPEMIIRKLKRVVEASKNFAKDLQRIKDAGGDQGLINELIGMGAEQGGIAAAGLASNLPALAEITALRSQVGTVGKNAWQLSQERLDSEAELTTAIKDLKKVVQQNTVKAKTQINIDAGMSAKEIINEIKRYERLNGKVFSN